MGNAGPSEFEQLKLYYDYTKWHVGLYAAVLVALLWVDRPDDVLLQSVHATAVVALVLAAACAGTICGTIPARDSLPDLNSRGIGVLLWADPKEKAALAFLKAGGASKLEGLAAAKREREKLGQPFSEQRELDELQTLSAAIVVAGSDARILTGRRIRVLEKVFFWTGVVAIAVYVARSAANSPTKASDACCCGSGEPADKAVP